MSQVLLELTAATDDAGTLQTFYLSTEPFVTGASDTPSNTAFDDTIIDPGSIAVHAFSDGRTGGRTKLDIGEIVLENVDGRYDAWKDYGFDGRPAVIRYSGAGVDALLGMDYWRPITSPLAQWRGLAWSPQLGLFCAVGITGIMTSPDGVNWTSQTDPFSNDLREVCWSPQLHLFCAVSALNSSGHRVMTSPDGVTWSQQATPENNQFFSVCWSPQLTLFVAVALNGTHQVMTSPDGINWTVRTAAAVSSWASVCWSPQLSLFVVVSLGINTKPVMTSPDGINWTLRAADQNSWLGVCWAPELGLFCAVAGGGANRAMTSPDGITWTSHYVAVPSVTWSSIDWSPEFGLFCAVAQAGTGNQVMTSPDGVNWTTRQSPASGWFSVCWSPELHRFAAVAVSGTQRAMIAPDPDIYPTNVPVIFRGTVQDVELDLAKVTITLRDSSYILDRPALTNTYAGTNVLPAGLEGTAADLKGLPKPKVYGTVKNVAPPCVNTSTLTYQLNDGALGSIDAVYDQGAALIFTANFATSALLQAATISSGHYSTCLAEGYFRLGSAPVGQVTADASASASDASRTTAQILGQIAQAAGVAAGNIWEQDQVQLDNANMGVVGIYVNDTSTTFADLMDAVAATLNAYYGFDVFGYFRMGQLTAAAGTTLATLTFDEAFDGIEVTPPIDNGIPCYSVQLAHSRNWTVQSTDLAGSVTQARRGFLAEADRIQVATNIAVQTKHSLATVDRVDTRFSNVVTPDANMWVGIAWSAELGLFAATSKDGTNRVMTSPDGINWTPRTAATATIWRSICWSPQLTLFVAVAQSGTGNRVMTSSDGVTWFSGTSAEDNTWIFVCWSPQLTLFVAVSSDGTHRVMTSPDGTTWTARTAAEANQWFCVCWAAELGLFCAVSSDGTHRVMTSTDGITWTARTAAEANSWGGVVWAAQLGIFCAVSLDGAHRVMTSPDGVTWTARTAAAVNSWFSICWSPQLGAFCAVALTGSNNAAMTSPDGINWTIGITQSNRWIAVVWSLQLGRFVAVSDSSNRTMVSSDGLTWIEPVNVADYEAKRRLALYGVTRKIYVVPISIQIFALISLRMLSNIELEIDRFGFDAGKSLRCIGYDFKLADGTVDLNLWG